LRKSIDLCARASAEPYRRIEELWEICLAAELKEAPDELPRHPGPGRRGDGRDRPVAVAADSARDAVARPVPAASAPYTPDSGGEAYTSGVGEGRRTITGGPARRHPSTRVRRYAVEQTTDTVRMPHLAAALAIEELLADGCPARAGAER